MPLNEIKVNEGLQSDGTTGIARGTRLGGLAQGNVQGYYYEQTSRGRLFSLVLNSTATGISVGNTVGVAAGSVTQFAVWNPPGSGKNLSLLKLGIWPISGTAPIPPISHSFTATAPTIGTSVVTPIACNNVGMAASSVARALTIAAQAGTALTGSSILAYIRAADLYITAGTAANLQGGKVIEYIDGDIVIPPGTGYVPTWVSNAALISGYSLTWEEIPI